MKGYHVARKAGWDCHGLPVELAVEKELGFTGKQDIEAYGIAEFNAKCRESVTRHTDAFAELTDAHGLLGRPGRRVPHDGPGLHRVGLVVAEGDLRQGPAGPGLPRRPLVPALRHRPVRPRAGAGLRDGRRPVGLRPLPADLRPAGRARRRCWSGRRRRGPWSPTPPSPRTPTSPTSSRRTASEKLVVAEPLLEKALGEGWEATGQTFTGARDGALDVPAALRPRRDPGRALRRPRRVRDHRGRHRPGPPGARLRRGRPARSAARTACRWSTRSAPTAPSRRTCRWSAASFFKKADEALVADLRGPRPAVPARAVRAQLPALLALPHRAALLRAAVLVHPHHRRQGRAAAGERDAPTGIPDTVKHGRYGDWLNNNVDWALSRNRYWGTPLPIWRCEEDHLTCVGSLRRARPS